MSVDVIYQLEAEHIRQLHQLYLKAWWTKARTLDETQRCVAGSQVCVGMVDETQQLIGFARVITDYTFKALVLDVIVDERHQGQRLGQRLMTLVKGHSQLKAVKHFELYCLPELTAFYAQHGFTTELGDIQLMRCVTA